MSWTGSPIHRSALAAAALATVALALALPGTAWGSAYGAVTWGGNEYADLGVGSALGPEACFAFSSCSTKPIGVARLADPVALGAGEDFECAVVSGGHVECWGRNDTGDLGDGSASGPEECPTRFFPKEGCSRTPVRVSGITNATAVAAGVGFACALLET